MEFSNVKNNIGPDYFNSKDFCESTYVSGILRGLHQILGASFDDYNFIIWQRTGRASHTEVVDISGLTDDRKQVVIYLGEERSSIPHELMKQNVFAVFKCYMPASVPYDNLFHMPLGYVAATHHLPVKPMNERKYNAFFSGAMHWVRLPFYQNFTIIKKLPFQLWNYCYRVFNKFFILNHDNYYPNSIIRFSKEGFRSGLPPEAYSELLYDSKIILCPRGIISYESFRHFEAMRAGCAIISEPLPDTFFYKNSPMIFIKDWAQLDGIMSDLIGNPDKLQNIQIQMLKWWDEVCSEKAVATYMAEKLELLSHSK